MNILILYATRGGVTRTCAEMLAKYIEKSGDVTISDIYANTPSPEKYDVVILGSSVRMSHIDKRVKQYIKQYTDILSNMPSAVFLCCGYTRQFEEYVDLQIPKTLLCSLGFHCFGGELKPEKRKGFDKLAVRIARNSILSQDFEESDRDHHALPEIFPENIRILADKIRSLH